jgi:hypothetical protein
MNTLSLKIKRLIHVLTIVISSNTALMAQCKIDYSNYQVVFEEDFDNITSITQLENRWMFAHDDPGWGWGGHDGEYYRREQVSILEDEGILRLTADRLEEPAYVWSDWLQDTRRPNYVSGMLQLRRDVSGAPFDGCNGFGGFIYGMFEIRMKIPKGVTYPAFWLIGPTQLNVYEGGFDPRYYGVGYDDEWEIDPNTGGHPF